MIVLCYRPNTPPSDHVSPQTTGAQKWHIVFLLGDVTSPTTVTDYVIMTYSEHRDALTAAPTADCVHKQAIRVKGEVHSSPLSKSGASLRNSSGWGTEAFPLSSVIYAPMPQTLSLTLSFASSPDSVHHLKGIPHPYHASYLSAVLTRHYVKPAHASRGQIICLMLYQLYIF